MLRPLLLGAALLSTALAQDEISLPADTNLFGGDLSQQESGASPRPGKGGQPNLAREGYGQTLVFKDGRELRGEVVEINGEQIIWKRPDASQPLRFMRSEVRRIVTGSSDRSSQNFLQRVFANQGGKQAKKSGKPSPVTLKLPGGDWLFGKATSVDGQTLSVQLGEISQLTVPRAKIEWMHFGEAPAPAFGFSGSTLDMEGWLPANATMELVDGTLNVKGSPWLGRNINQTDSFEISFELPADAEEGTRLWLQPFGPQPNCYGQGTAEIRFGRKEISHMLFLDKFARIKEPLPKESLEEQGPAKYRVFYSEDGKRVSVLRNGRKVGDWTYLENKDPAGNAVVAREFRFNGICFDHENQDLSKPLKFTQLRMLPWNGVLPQAGQADDDQDHFTPPKGATVSGKLESLTEKELTFSGTKQPTESGTFLRFPQLKNAAFADVEAKLDFGQQGEFTARHLVVHDGKVHCETSFASDLELPLTALQRLTFPAQASPASAITDVVVFKNGDELPGKALSVGFPGLVRWRTANGQEVNFDSTRIAGLRLAADGKAAEANKIENSAAMIELRNGERLPGKLLALDDKQLRLEHAQFGPLALDRTHIWHLFPNAQLQASDGGLTPGGWKWTDPGAKVENRPKTTMESARWVHLDGTYFIRNSGNVSYFDVSTMAGLEHQISTDMERFEVRVETTGLGGQAGNFLMALIGKNTTTLNATLSYSELQAVVMNPQGNRPNWREIPLQEKLGVNNTHRAMRLFVDTKAGTCDFVINGVHLARLGAEKSERLQKAQYTARLVPYPNQTSVFSNLWLGPWNGELPISETEPAGTTALANGDVAPGIPKCLREGRLAIDSELGELSFPLEKTLALDFGGAMEARRAPARLRLADGTTINVETFQWEGAELTAHSGTLGDLRLPADTIQEIIFDPAPPQPPMAVLPKALAQKRAKENTRILPDR
ncbi:MAG TPA: hypothetical protein VK961_00905 [Chthoniobacter sp.]|nr:hypothetical protein [Chthoniobacter sp.]